MSRQRPMDDKDRAKIIEHSEQLEEQAKTLLEIAKKDAHLQQQINGLYLIAQSNNTSISGLIETSKNLLASVAELRGIVDEYIRVSRNGHTGQN